MANECSEFVADAELSLDLDPSPVAAGVLLLISTPGWYSSL